MKNAFGVVDEVDNISFDMAFGRTGDANWLIQSQINILLFRLFNNFSIYLDCISNFDFTAEFGRLSIDGHTSRFDELIGSAAGSDACFAYKLIDSHNKFLSIPYFLFSFSLYMNYRMNKKFRCSTVAIFRLV